MCFSWKDTGAGIALSQRVLGARDKCHPPKSTLLAREEPGPGMP